MRPVVLLAIVPVLALALQGGNHKPKPKPPVDNYKKIAVPFMQTYCVSCHSGPKPADGKDISKLIGLKPAEVTEKARWFKKMAAEVKEHEMPPAKAKAQPKEKEAEAFVKWADSLKGGAKPAGKPMMEKGEKKEGGKEGGGH